MNNGNCLLQLLPLLPEDQLCLQHNETCVHSHRPRRSISSFIKLRTIHYQHQKPTVNTTQITHLPPPPTNRNRRPQRQDISRRPATLPIIIIIFIIRIIPISPLPHMTLGRAGVVLWDVVLLGLLGRIVLEEGDLNQQTDLFTVSADDTDSEQGLGLLDPVLDLSKLGAVVP